MESTRPASLTRRGLAGYGDTAGQEATATAFKDYLESQDLLASKVKATDRAVDDFLEFFLVQQHGGNYCQSDEGNTSGLVASSTLSSRLYPTTSKDTDDAVQRVTVTR